MSDADVQVTRKPILITEHTIALLTLFRKPEDSLDDLWTLDYIQGEPDTAKVAAKEFVNQLCSDWNAAFLMALRDELNAKLKEHDKCFGTRFAISDQYSFILR